MRALLYWVARLLGDLNALFGTGNVGRRIKNRALGKITWRLFRK